MDQVVASEGMQTAAADMALTGITDYTDIAGVVKLVTTPFTAAKGIDETTIPGNVTEFTSKTSGVPVGMTTVDPPGRSVLFPEPIGGWTFTSAGGTYPQTVYGYRVDNATNFVGCKNIPQQVITAAGQTVIIPVVRIPVDAEPYKGL